MPQYKNILIALDGQMSEKTMMAVKEAFLQVFESYKDRLQVGRLDFVDNKEDVDRMVSGVDYDVLLIAERIRGVNIGAGSIKTWQKKNRLLDIILFVSPQKKGGEKVRALHREGYYNTVYSSDLKHPSVIIDIILNGRTAESATLYYGIEDMGYSVSENTSIAQDYSQDVLGGMQVADEVVSVVTNTVSELSDDAVAVPVREEVESVLKQPVEEERNGDSVESVNAEGEGMNSEVNNPDPVVLPKYVTDEDVKEDTGRETLSSEYTTTGVFMEEVDEDMVSDEASHEEKADWITEERGYSSVEESPTEYTEYTDPLGGEVYMDYKQRGEVSVLNRKELDASALGGESAVMVRARVATVVSDSVMVIECPNGGLMKNKGLMENRVITLLM